MSDCRLTCLIGNPSKTEMSYRQPTCLIRDPQNMLDQACQSPMGLRSGMLFFNWACLSPIRHVGLRTGPSVFDGFNQAYQSPMSLHSDMLIFNGSPMGLQQVSNSTNIFCELVLKFFFCILFSFYPLQYLEGSKSLKIKSKFTFSNNKLSFFIKKNTRIQYNIYCKHLFKADIIQCY